MDYFLLKQLRAQLLHDLKKFLPKYRFIKEGQKMLSFENGKDISGQLASESTIYLCQDLLTNHQDSILTARQLAASELFVFLETYLLFPCNNESNEIRAKCLKKSLGKYLNYLGKKAKPFVSLPESDLDKTIQQAVPQKNKGRRVNQMRAFLNDCFNKGVEKNIESVWLHIQKHAGEAGFLFKTASKSTATTIYEEDEKKCNLGRRLNTLIKLMQKEQ